MIEQIMLLVAIILGYCLRDLHTKIIKQKTEKITKKLFPSKTEVLEWKPKKTTEQEDEEQAKENMHV